MLNARPSLCTQTKIAASNAALCVTAQMVAMRIEYHTSKSSQLPKNCACVMKTPCFDIAFVSIWVLYSGAYSAVVPPCTSVLQSFPPWLDNPSPGTSTRVLYGSSCTLLESAWLAGRCLSVFCERMATNKSIILSTSSPATRRRERPELPPSRPPKSLFSM